MSNRSLKIVLPIVVLAALACTAGLIASSRQPPQRIEQQTQGPLVEVMTTVRADIPVEVTGHGEVVARVAVTVVPQVTGQVVHVHPSLVAGGFFSAGETLLVIDPRDYELALERAEATVARAQVVLEQEQAEARVAREEWDGLHPDEQPPSGLVLREPQVRQAEAELVAARADLETARLNLERTRVSVPFDGVVVAKNVDVGQFVGSNSQLATIYGTKLVEVRVPLSSGELEWIGVPYQSRGELPTAEVSADFAGTRHTWYGRVARMEAEVDQSSRMVHVVIEVENPYQEQPPLLPGTFVDVRIAGRTLAGVVPVPRHAVHEEMHVWVFSDGRLEISEVEVLRADREQALIGAGLAGGEQVIISALDAVTDGMTVRTIESSEQVRAGAAGGVS